MLPRGGRIAAAAAIAMSIVGARVGAQPACPGTASLAIFVDNQSAASSLAIAVEGELAAGTSTCTGNGATTYQAALTCTGTGTVRCGQMDGLAPGAWVHRLSVTVPGSDTQSQVARAVLVAGSTDVSNAVVWTVYPRTFVVHSTSANDLQGRLDDAAAYTQAGGGPVLVTFDPGAFPGAAAPQRISLLLPVCALDDTRNRCRPNGTSDGTTAGLCLTGDRIVVDALDRNAQPGGVILSVGACGRQVLRLYGADDVLRGLVFEGSRKPSPTLPFCQVDTVSVTGEHARRNRIERSVILGPTCGDALSIDNDAGQPDAEGPEDDVVVDTRITGAQGKGVKVDFGGTGTIARSCVHDNQDGGIQSTLGGHVSAIQNVVQHNVPGAAQNGLSVVGTTDTSTLATDGNVVRLSGGRGLSVTDNASATFANDYVADNQFTGSRVETSANGPVAAVPTATFHGVALVCNRHENLTGTCSPSPGNVELPCTTAVDCCTAADDSIDPACVAATTCAPGSFPRGFGAVTASAQGHATPIVSYGDAVQGGRNAFSSNRNTPAGANFQLTNLDGVVPADGNQWEHCGSGATCDVTGVLANDVAPAGAGVDLGTPPGPSAGPPVLLRIEPARPQAGDVVRVYGDNFDAIDGNPLFASGAPNCADLPACAPDGSCPAGPCVKGTCPCAITNPAVEQQNQQAGANRIRIKTKTGTILGTLYPDAVTPTMLAFHMPFDCFAPLVLEVAKRDPSGNRLVVTLPLCDARGCADRPAGTPCDDGNACTVNDACDGNGQCLGTPLACAGPCLTCDPTAGCVPKPATAGCDDGNACTAGDHCSGDANLCVGGRAVVCGGQCLTGTCDPVVGCLPKPAGSPCNDGDACTVGEHCSGGGNVCLSGSPRDCSGSCLSGACDSQRGCLPAPLGTACDDGNACTVGDRCSGAGVCLAGSPLTCVGACLTGACDPQLGCMPRSSSTVCRQASGPCDAAETCDGVHATCPLDAVLPATAICRPVAGPCDVAEACDGTSKICPVDSFAPATQVCRPAVDACDVADTCPGTGAACPALDRTKTDIAGVTCAFDRRLVGSACADQLVPLGVARLFDRAHRKVTLAAGASVGRRSRLLDDAAARLRRALTLLARAEHRRRDPITSACAASIRAVLGDAISRITLLRGTLGG
jgi:hypothetical protein